MSRSLIVHFGVGNFHRSHQAKYLHDLHERGIDLDWHIVGAGVLSGDVRMRDAMREQGFVYTLVERDADGVDVMHRVATIRDYLFGPDDPDALISLLANPDTRIVTMTITEGAYNLSDITGEFDTSNTSMLDDRWDDGQPTTVFGYLAAALRRRRTNGLSPFTVLSCDNMQNNGRMARAALIAFVAMSDPGLAEWIASTMAFPNSMVDRITPATTDEDREWVRTMTGVDDPWPVISEAFTQWVIEDHFTSGRPRWEEAGAQIVDDVAPFESMKLRMLNGSHQAIAYAGLLNGYEYVHDAVSDPSIASSVDSFMREAQQTVPAIPGVDLDGYRNLLLKRFSNRAIRDTLLRLATDASDRIPKFVVPVARDLLRRDERAPHAAAVIATWVAVADMRLRESRALPDRQAPAVAQSLGHERALSGSFLDNPNWFARLGENAVFRSDYVRSLEDLRSTSPEKPRKVRP